MVREFLIGAATESQRTWPVERLWGRRGACDRVARNMITEDLAPRTHTSVDHQRPPHDAERCRSMTHEMSQIGFQSKLDLSRVESKGEWRLKRLMRDLISRQMMSAWPINDKALPFEVSLRNDLPEGDFFALRLTLWEKAQRFRSALVLGRKCVRRCRRRPQCLGR